MKHRSKYLNYSCLLMALVFLIAGCSKDETYQVPVPKDVLQNDAIKRTVTVRPNIVGDEIEFAYAMAILPQKGKLVSAEVEASIAGATGTYLEHRSFYTSNSGTTAGDDIGIPIGLPSVNAGTKSTVTFNVDTSAATLRYYYKIPEEARGRTVSFTFSARSSNGESVSYQLGPYDISTMDMALNIPVSNNSRAYFSIADMTSYTAAEAATRADKIDLVYVYRPAPFSHSLVSPAADAMYLPGVTLPTGVNRSSKIIKTFNLLDRQLAPNRATFYYVEDESLKTMDFSTAPNFAINLRAEAGAWVETADGKYRAYIVVNSVNNGAGGSAVISMKRYTVN